MPFRILECTGYVSGDLLRTEREVLACLAETEMGVGIWLSPSRTNELIHALSTRAQGFVKENLGKEFKDIQNHSDRLEAFDPLGLRFRELVLRKGEDEQVISRLVVKSLKQLKDYQLM